jgi:hypothetical protein
VSAPQARRSSFGRLVAAIVVSLVVGGLSTVAFVSAAVYHAGTVEVEIWEERGEHVSVAVPASLVTGVLNFLPRRVYIEAASEVEPYWDAARAATRELARMQDGVVLVAVTGPDLKVRVAKEDGRLVVDVDEGGTRVHVSVPVKIVADIVDKLDF